MSRNQDAKSQKQGPQPSATSTQAGDDQISNIKHQTSREKELLADLQRIQAEFINYKNRVENEKATLSQFSRAQTIKELLPIIDDLERALARLPQDFEENKWALGVRSVYDRLQGQLQKLGVQKIEALNQPFDPNLHEAVQVEGKGDLQIVSEILQNGYLLAGQVIRHAVVKVKNS